MTQRPRQSSCVTSSRFDRSYYAPIITTPAPVNEENFRNYGASTTPTLVLVDRAGIVRVYHPGTMTYEELREAIERLMRLAA